MSVSASTCITPNPDNSQRVCGILTTPSLTFTFTPPFSCLHNTLTLSPYIEDRVIDVRGYAYRGVQTQCFPPGYFLATSVIDRGPAEETLLPQSFFSPGVCPKNYAGMVTSVANGETSVACCPM